MNRLIYPAAIGLVVLTLASAAFSNGYYSNNNDASTSNSATDKNADGGINTGTGTVPNGSLKDNGASEMNAPPNGTSDQSGGIDSGPAGSLRHTDVIPGSNTK